MKKILSLFLSFMLVFSMTISAFIPGAVLATSGDKTLINQETVYDTTGALAGYTTVFSTTHFMACTPPGASSAVTHSAIEIRNSYRLASGDEFRLVRYNDKDKYISYYPKDDPDRDNRDANIYGGIYTYTGKYMSTAAKEDGTIDYQQNMIRLNRSSPSEVAFTIGTLKANTWYEYEYVVDGSVTPHTFTVKYKNIDETLATGTPVYDYQGESTFTADTFVIRVDMDLAETPSSFESAVNYEAYKDLKLVKTFPSITKTQAEILSVNSDAAVTPNQNQVTFTLDNAIEGLAADKIWAEDSNSVRNAATDIALSSDGKTVTATLTSNLVPWSNYTLKIDPSVYNGFVKAGDYSEVSQSELQKTFIVAAEGFAMREISITSSASDVSFNMEYTNTESSPVSATLVLAVYSNNGVMVDIAANTPTNLPVDNATEVANISASFGLGNSAKMFVIKSWSDLTPHFSGKYWSVDAEARVLESNSGAEPITLGEFDYENKKINVGINTGAGTQTCGVLYVYDNSAALSDTVLPIYADYITTALDGTFKVDVPFKDDIDADTASYTVAFYTPDGFVVSDGFTCYDAADLFRQKEVAIYEAAKASTTVGGLKQIILGIDDLENVVNDNFTVFDVKADLAVYNALANKDKVFSLMISSVSALADYDALVDLFEAKSLEQYVIENTVNHNPSSDNLGYGGTGGVIKDTPAVVPISPNNPAVSGGLGFSDMNGHWASEFASELSKRGIMTGYPNGTFGAEGLITRAELAKTLVVATDIALGTASNYTDVDISAWHSPYVAGAAKAGVITGFEDGSFGPDMSVTRQDAALMLYRALGTKVTLPVGYTFFKDDFDISDYASDAIRCLGELQIIQGGPDGKFNPLAPITRGEIAALICRALDYIESH